MATFWKPGAEAPVEHRKSGQKETKKGKNNHTKNVPLQQPPSSSSSYSSTRISGGSDDLSGSPKLSKAVLSMRFMKRKADAELQKTEVREKKQRLLEPQWSSKEPMTVNEDMPARLSTCSSNYNTVNFVEESENDVYTLYPARRSFGGFNTMVERYCTDMLNEQRFERASRSTISEDEMVLRYEKMIGLSKGIGGKSYVNSDSTKKGKKKAKRKSKGTD